MMTSTLRAILVGAALSTAALALGACSDDDTVNPVPTDAGVDATTPDGGDDAGPPKRTITQKNPFGNVKESQNLLWDGDFEWFSVFSDEYAWLNGPPFISATFTGVEVGPQCYSGLKCVAIPGNAAIVGIGVASKGDALEASFFASPALGDCGEIQGHVISPFDSPAKDPPVEIKALTKKPNAAGWCEYRSVIAARTEKPGFYVQNKASAASGKRALVDDCVLKVASKDKTEMAAPGMDEETTQKVERARADIAKYHRGPHDPPPNAARRALEAWRPKR